MLPPPMKPPMAMPPACDERFCPIESSSSMNRMQAPRRPGSAYLRASPRASRNSFMIISWVMPMNMPWSELESM